MPKVHFTPNLERHLECKTVEVSSGSLKDVLEAVFNENPNVKGYVVNDQGAIRKHVAVFIDGTLVRNRKDLSQPVAEGAEIYVMQALSGG